MNKKNTIIFLLFLVVLSACGVKLLSIKNVQVENLKTQVVDDYYNGDSKIALLKKIIRNSEEYDIDFSKDDCSHKIICEHYVGKNKVYYLYIDIISKNVYLMNDEHVLRVKKSVATELLANDVFSSIYIEKTAPKMILKKDGNEIPLSKQYQWTYKKADENIYEKTVKVNETKKLLYLDDTEGYEIIFSEIPDDYVIKIFKDNKIIKTAKTIDDAFSDIKEDGLYYVEINAEWNKTLSRENYGIQTINFIADLDFEPELKLNKNELFQGDALSVTINNINQNDTYKIVCTFFQKEIHTFRENNNVFCLIPIGMSTSLGEYEIRCIVNEGLQNESVISKQFTVNKRNFKTQHINISDEIIENTQSEQATDEYIQVVKKARESSYEEALWEDKFIMPVENYILTTEFGQIRYVNDDETPSIHSGLDLAADTGTEIFASNTGIVKVSRYLAMTGNTVVIDHGMGLFTTYFHLDTLDLIEDSIVTKGDVIGTVGSTGFSTGPHLHFCVSIYNDFINTYQPIEEILK